jgi:hypothetical protein
LGSYYQPVGRSSTSRASMGSSGGVNGGGTREPYTTSRILNPATNHGCEIGLECP